MADRPWFARRNHIIKGEGLQVHVSDLTQITANTHRILTDLDLTGTVTLAPIGSSPNANGATRVGTTLNLEPASAAFGGVVTTGAQTFAGVKNFQDGILIAGAPLESPIYSLNVATTPTGFAGAITVTNPVLYDVGRIGKLVTFQAPFFSVTAAIPAENGINLVGALDPQFRPDQDRWFLIDGQNNTLSTQVVLQVKANGNVTVQLPNGGAITPNFGIFATSVSYMTA